MRNSWSGVCVGLVATLSLVAVGCSGEVPDGGMTSSSHKLTNTSKLGTMLKVVLGKGITAKNYKKAMPAKLVSLKLNKAGDVTTSVLIKAKLGAITKLGAMGIKVRSVTSTGIMTATVPLNKLNAVAALTEISHLEAAKPVRMYNDLSNQNPGTGCTTCLGMNNPRGASNGAGIIVGIIDSGIDFTHGDFIDDATGKSRILHYWDHSDIADGKPPTGFTYGHEYSSVDLDTYNAGTTSAVRSAAFDTDGHGTHVAGTAAGDGSASGKTGAAPAAEIIFVKFDFEGDRNDDSYIIDGVNYIFQKAAALGKPAVINMSLGSDYGPHDGTTLEERGISDLTGPGKVVVVAAGNPGASNWSEQLAWGFAMHGSGNMGTNGDAITFRFPSYIDTNEDYVFFDIWYPAGNNKCRVEVTTPNTQTYPPGSKQYKNWWVTNGTGGGFNTGQGVVFVYNGGDQMGWGDTNTDHEAYVEISDYNDLSEPFAGTYTIRLVPADSKSTCSGTYHAWYGVSGSVVKGWQAEPTPRSATPRFGGVESDNTVTIGTPASADKVIAVAAYQTRNSWDYVWGTTCSDAIPYQSQAYGVAPITYYDPYGLGELANFSARGPRRDGVLKPEIAAPGVGIASSFSHFVRDAELADKCVPYFGSGGPYHYGLNRVLPGEEATILQGTSMACPNATGAIALLLQQKADLDDACLRQVFAGSALHDAATDLYENTSLTAKTDTDNNAGSGLANNDWGFGKMDITASLTYLTANGYVTCAGDCKTDADCGVGQTCTPSTDVCGCGSCSITSDPCGNSQLDPGEACDPSVGGSAQCPAGWSGTATCNGDCTLNISSCTAPQSPPCASNGATCSSDSACCSGRCKRGTCR